MSYLNSLSLRSLIYQGVTILFLIFTPFCEKSPYEEYDPQLNVFCILRNDKPKQELTVDRTYKIAEVAKYDLEDVRVILSGNGFCDTLVHVYDTIGIFITKDTFPISALAKYRLEVSAAGLETLKGETTLPGDFAITFPLDGDTIALTDTVIFEKSENALRYYIDFIPEDNLMPWFGFSISAGIFSDTIKFSLADYLWDFELVGDYKVKITALDSNCVNYQEFWNEDTIPQFGVWNGIGLFGSAWVESTKVFIDKKITRYIRDK